MHSLECGNACVAFSCGNVSVVINDPSHLKTSVETTDTHRLLLEPRLLFYVGTIWQAIWSF
jgi:hypothetical protein